MEYFARKELLFLFITLAVNIALIALLVRVFKGNNRQPTTRTNGSYVDELERLHSLKEKGVITQQEFDNIKAKLIQTL